MSSRSVYQQVMGADFEQLPGAVKTFHSACGAHRFRGRVAIDGAENWLGRVIARMGRLPRGAPESDFEFSLNADSRSETWRRHFSGGDMCSVLHPQGERLVEVLGIFRLRFRLEAEENKLAMRLERIIAFGLPCPRALFPSVIAEETGEGAEFRFNIEMHTPLAGRVVRYRGYLDVSRLMR